MLLLQIVFWFMAAGLPTHYLVLLERRRREGFRWPPEVAVKHRRTDLFLAFGWLLHAGISLIAGTPELFWGWMYGACAWLWCWWRNGGGDNTRRLVEKGTGRVKVFGAQLVVVPEPAG